MMFVNHACWGLELDIDIMQWWWKNTGQQYGHALDARPGPLLHCPKSWPLGVQGSEARSLGMSVGTGAVSSFSADAGVPG